MCYSGALFFPNIDDHHGSGKKLKLLPSALQTSNSFVTITPLGSVYSCILPTSSIFSVVMVLILLLCEFWSAQMFNFPSIIDIFDEFSHRSPGDTPNRRSVNLASYFREEMKYFDFKRVKNLCIIRSSSLFVSCQILTSSQVLFLPLRFYIIATFHSFFSRSLNFLWIVVACHMFFICSPCSDVQIISVAVVPYCRVLVRFLLSRTNYKLQILSLLLILLTPLGYFIWLYFIFLSLY